MAVRRLALVVTVLLITSACAPTSDAEPLVLTRELEAELQATLDASLDDGGLPGAQAAVVFPDGRVWSGSSGVADRDAGDAVTAETRFPIGSITKLFTATVVLRLAEREELSLEDAVTAWLPDEPVDDRVTIRQLLSHTSGLPGQDESTCEPGMCVNYSNVGYSLLGRIIESVTGDSVVHAYHTEIVDELELGSTALGTQEAVPGPQATGHNPDGPLQPADVTVRWTDPGGEVNIGSSGAIVSTARDTAWFAAELFRGKLLEPQTMNEMLDFDPYLDLAGADECRARGLGVLRESANTEFGLSWGHNGIVSGFTAAVSYYPGYDIAIAVLVNATGIGGGAQATEELLAELLLDGQPPIDPDRGRGRCVQDVYTIRPDGSDLSNVTNDPRLDWSVTWSPDSRRLLYASGLADDGDLYVVDLDGSGLEQITDSPGVDGTASWSPDGATIVFVSERSGERAIYTASADGTGAELLIDGVLPAWSPRGDTIAYSAPGPGGDMDLWLIDADGLTQWPIVTEEGDDLWANWSPDASAIAFANGGTLAVVDVETGTVTPVEVDVDGIGDPSVEFASWGSTGRIAFIAGSEIWTVNPDGTDPFDVGGSPGRDLNPVWSPDGEHIAFIGSRWSRQLEPGEP